MIERAGETPIELSSTSATGLASRAVAHPYPHALITGASSPIARALAERLAQHGHSLTLAGRSVDEIERTAADLRIRFGMPVEVLQHDADGAAEEADRLLQACESGPNGAVALLVICHGLFIDQVEAEADVAKALQLIQVNYVSAAALLERAAVRMKRTEGGMLVAITSVAGDRGRRSNYLYGAPKAGLSCHIEGLRYRLDHHRIAVLDVRPGFVDTSMTWGKVNSLIAPPARVARDIHQAIRRQRSGVLYTPGFWRWIMFIVRSIPVFVFKRLSL